MTVTALSDEQLSDLQAWRAEALIAMPYMASMLMSLRPVNAPGMGTFAVDAHYRLYIDFEAVADWSARLCAEALLHECSHLFADHAARAADVACVADHERPAWNLASDCEINDDLRDAGCDELAGMGFFATKLGEPDYQTAEHYMDVIRKKQQQQSSGAQGQRQQGNGQPGQGQSPGQTRGGNPYRGCGSCSGGSPAPGELPADDDADGIAPAANAIEHERNRIATASTIRDYAHKGRDSVPGGLSELAEQILKPSKVPWRTVLSAALRRAVAMRCGDYDSTYSRRHRRTPSVTLSPTCRVIRPGTFEPKPTIAVVRDTSGSMGVEEINAVTNEVEAIAKQLGIRGRDLTVLDVDAAVHTKRDYQGAASLAQVTGRGGTDMRVGIEAAAGMKPRPHAVVVVTDGYTPWPDERTRMPVVACLVGEDAEQSREAVPDWIVSVVVEGG